jgi:hypothetical protein
MNIHNRIHADSLRLWLMLITVRKGTTIIPCCQKKLLQIAFFRKKMIIFVNDNTQPSD